MQIFQFKKSKIPVKAWINKDDIEETALQQLENVVQLPFIFKHLAVMPDVHAGFGITIGSVLATKDVIIPNAVGLDIGCGMCAVKTSLTELDTETLKKIMGEIRKAIPVGFEHHKEKQAESLMPDVSTREYGIEKPRNVFYDIEDYCSMLKRESYEIVSQEYQSALKQIGTLGGGNHFIEIQKGSDGHIWIMIHSGSRNLGKKVADYYNLQAKVFNNKWYSSVPLKYDLAFLPISSELGEAYIREMNYCVEFALANRKLMMDKIIEIVDTITLNTFCEPMINIAHNYASLENHFGENVWVHRKGATLAREDTIGIIPGSQGTKSYIVKGKGNPESFMSCSHGAGRTMSRTNARKTLDLETEKKKLDDLGTIHAIRSISDLDEAAGAYKNIQQVMQNQSDLVEILVELQPLAVIKG